MSKKFRAFTTFTESAAGGELKSTPDVKGHRTFRGVTIIKAGLGNKRDKHFYPADTLKEAVAAGLFDGLRAYLDHPTSVDQQIQPERTLRDLAGIYDKPRFVENASGERVVADLHIMPSHKWLAESIESLMSLGYGDKIGISINGRGTTTPDRMQLEEGGEPVEIFRVKKFTALPSADLVTEAGAGGGFQQLMESATGAGSRQQGADDMKRTSIQQDLQKLLTEGGVTDEKVKALLAAHPEAAIREGDDEDGEDDEDEDEAAEADAETAEADADDDDDDAETTEAGADDAETIEGRGGKDCGCGKKMSEGHKGAKMGTAIRPSKRKSTVGRKFGESAEVRQLRQDNERLRARNTRLSEAVTITQKRDRVNKLVRESKLPAAVQGPLAKRLMRLSSEAEVRDEISFQQSLLESAADSVAADFGFDEVEGAGARFREAAGSGGGSGDSSLREAVSHHLPLKKTK